MTLRTPTLYALILLSLTDLGCQAQARSTSPTVVRVPDGGIQPQVAAGEDGVVHLVYYRGEPAAGDLFYARRAPGSDTFSPAIRVNSRPGSAVAIGTIRGAQIALGAGGRLHVVWNGSARVKEATGHDPLLYTRLNDDGTAFEPERNVITHATGLDGGSSVAADGEGNVYVVWHAGPHGSPESERAVYVARSRDGGRSFERERKVSPDATGVCGCCALKAYADKDGAVYIVYRGARETVHRDEHLLISRDDGASFAHRVLHPWNVAACPMSSAALHEGHQGVVAGWQTGEQVFFAPLREEPGSGVSPVAAPGGGGMQKHPVMASRPDGAMLLAWTEGTGWAKGGRLRWQAYDREGAPTGEAGSADDVPVWSMPAAYTDADGRFVLVY